MDAIMESNKLNWQSYAGLLPGYVVNLHNLAPTGVIDAAATSICRR